MSQRVVHRLGFLLGVLLLAIGVFMLVRASQDKYLYKDLDIRTGKPLQDLKALEEFLRKLYERKGEDLQRLPAIKMEGEELLIHVKVKAPRNIYVDESASVSVYAAIPTTREFSLTLKLAAPGLNVEPKDWLRLHPESHDWVGVWSVRASRPGSYLLVFNPKLEVSDSDPEYAEMKRLVEMAEMKRLVEMKRKKKARRNEGQKKLAEMEGKKILDAMLRIEFDPRADIPLEVKQRWRSYLSAAWGPVVAFMGSLLTLPGIISFLKDRKREREEKKKQSSVFE